MVAIRHRRVDFEPLGSTALPLFFSLVLLLPWIPGPVPAAFLLWAGRGRGRVACSGRRDGHRTERVKGLFRRKQAKQGRGPFPRLDRRAVALRPIPGGGWWLSPILPGGDEPHYLVIAESLLGDGDMRIENNHVEQHIASSSTERCVRTT